jgi:adenylate cyclase
VAAGDGWRKRAIEWLPQAISLLLLGFLAWGYLQPSVLKDRLANLAFDTMQRLFPREHEAAGVWVLDIDEASLARYGQWPWPRTVIARIVDELGRREVAAVGFDVVLAEPDRTSPARALAPLLAQQPGLAEQLPPLPDHDAVLAAALARNRAVMGFVLSTEKPEAGPAGGAVETADDQEASAKIPVLRKAPAISVNGEARRYLPRMNRAVISLPEFHKATAGNGNFGFVPDQDGVVRRVHLMWSFGIDEDPSKAVILPGLAAETLRVAERGRGFRLELARAEDAFKLGVAPGLVAVHIDKRKVPTDASGAMWLHYARRPLERYLPVWKLLEGAGDLPDLKDGIVLVGTSAQGLLDLRFSPHGIVPGVEMHAQTIEQIRAGRFLQRPEWTESVELLAMLAVGVPLVLLVGTLGALGTAVLGAVGVAVGMAGVWWAFTAQQVLLAPIYPWLGITAVYVLCTGVRFFQTEREGRFIRSAFASYVSPNLVSYLVEHPEQLRLGGERRECSFVLTDLAGFTTLVERSEPEALVALLNDYIEGMTDIAFKHGGTLDRIVGDAVAVMFSAPVAQPDHAARAVACAMEMNAFSRRFSRSRTTPERRVGRTRIGVHSGTVIIGNFGGGHVFDYRALGDAINTTARLETVNRHLNTRVCVSAATAAQVPGFRGRPAGRLVLKGKSEPIEAFEPLTAEQDAAPRTAAYREAYALLDAGDPRAQAAFAALGETDGLASFHLERLRRGEAGTLVVMEEK